MNRKTPNCIPRPARPVRTLALACSLLGALLQFAGPALLATASSAPYDAVAEDAVAQDAKAQEEAQPSTEERDTMERSFEHDTWTRVLEQVVTEDGWVDYEALAQDRDDFDRYLAQVKKISPRSHPQLFPTRDDALAYYINAYNALVFDGVLERGPEETSVWRGIVSGYTFFVRMRVRLGGETMNLKSLEDDIIRAEFQDARIHAALNCASIGCPRLPREAFLADRLDAQLDRAMTGFATHARHVAVDAEKQEVELSKIFEWFADDFLSDERRRGVEEPSILTYINRFRDASERIPETYTVRYSEYDKRINNVQMGASVTP